MPGDLDCYSMAIRGLWINHDHYSDLGTSYEMPSVPDKCRMDAGKKLFSQFYLLN